MRYAGNGFVLSILLIVKCAIIASVLNMSIYTAVHVMEISVILAQSNVLFAILLLVLIMQLSVICVGELLAQVALQLLDLLEKTEHVTNVNRISANLGKNN